ncbi:MAG: helix-turn-helix domain-containing protein [Methylotenera sp.]
MNLQEAAAFLKIHTVTLSIKASNGEINGAKIGKRWVFLKVDLIMHIRSQYQLRALQCDIKKEQIYHFTNAKTRPSGGLRSLSVDEEYKKALGQATKSKPRNTTTS